MPAEPKPSTTSSAAGTSSSTAAGGGGSKKRSLAPKRGAIACVRCKERKAKCVPAPPGTSPVPTCTNCLTAKKECVYLERTPNEIFLLEYVSQLEARCAALEVELRKANPSSSFASDHIQMPAEARSAAVNKLNQVYPPSSTQPDSAAAAAAPPPTAPIPINNANDNNGNNNTIEVKVEEGPSSVPSTGSGGPELTVDGEEDEQDLALGIGMLSLGGGEEPVYVGPSSGINWARVCATALRRPREATQPRSHLSRFSYLAPPELASVQSALEYTLHHPTPPLPPPALATHYLELVYEHIQARYGCFDWTAVKNWHENRQAICQGRPLWGVGTGNDERRNLASFFLWLCYGYGARLSEDEKLEGAVSHEVYYNAAVACLSTLTSHHSVATVQALVLLIIYGLRHPTAEVAVWQVGGLAMRTAVELGMHRRLRSRSEREKDPMRYEMKKRVFWAVYTLDRMMAAQLGRPAGIQDRDIDAELPLNVDVDFGDARALYAMQNRQIELMAGRRPGDEYNNGYGPVSSMTSAIHNIRMNQLKQMITDAIYRLDKPLRPRDPDAHTAEPERQSYDEVDDLLRRLDQWRACHPQPKEGIPMLPHEQWELEYHNCVQLLLRPIVASCKAAGRYVTLCLDSAAALCDTQYNYLQPPVVQSKLSTWRFYRLFLAGLTLLHIITTFHPYLSESDRQKAENAIRKCQSALGVFGSKFKAASRHEGLFRELVSAWENGMGTVGQTAGHKKDSADGVLGSPGPGPGLAGIGIESTAEEMIARLFDIGPTPPSMIHQDGPIGIPTYQPTYNQNNNLLDPSAGLSSTQSILGSNYDGSSSQGQGQGQGYGLAQPQNIPTNQQSTLLPNSLASPTGVMGNNNNANNGNNGLSLSLESLNSDFPPHSHSPLNHQSFNSSYPLQQQQQPHTQQYQFQGSSSIQQQNPSFHQAHLTGGLQSTDDWASMLGEMGGGMKDDFFSLMSSFGLDTHTQTPMITSESSDPIFDFLTSPQPTNPTPNINTTANTGSTSTHHTKHDQNRNQSQSHNNQQVFPLGQNANTNTQANTNSNTLANTIFPGSGNSGSIWDMNRRDSNLGMSDWAGLFDGLSSSSNGLNLGQTHGQGQGLAQARGQNTHAGTQTQTQTQGQSRNQQDNEGQRQGQGQGNNNTWGLC
ncbi:uncharacterized protein I303_106007 [Kwoniella dejecticola CBS 10117]|uniref:Zn(2)-C6 fungal-type domain-containing protein n=1 Tax=Kwoniella dejecticola CBS 10117 TaxID=1296121 RepID=A0A1A6A124_9TREE|nr:uncharacterized protein I303_06027 [Kwoniella dejecticola CBS 10117]OBR83747.1 hypothetical protein I303_06027 [Kwoniella dejecticola CBS 10117]